MKNASYIGVHTGKSGYFNLPVPPIAHTFASDQSYALIDSTLPGCVSGQYGFGVILPLVPSSEIRVLCTVHTLLR
jgi:hypothetical protein